MPGPRCAACAADAERDERPGVSVEGRALCARFTARFELRRQWWDKVPGYLTEELARERARSGRAWWPKIGRAPLALGLGSFLEETRHVQENGVGAWIRERRKALGYAS